MSGRLSTQYRLVVHHTGQTTTDKAALEGMVTRKREAIRLVRQGVRDGPVGSFGEVYGGEKLNALVYQVRSSRDDHGHTILIIDEL